MTLIDLLFFAVLGVAILCVVVLAVGYSVEVKRALHKLEVRDFESLTKSGYFDIAHLEKKSGRHGWLWSRRFCYYDKSRSMAYLVGAGPEDVVVFTLRSSGPPIEDVRVLDRGEALKLLGMDAFIAEDGVLYLTPEQVRLLLGEKPSNTSASVSPHPAHQTTP
jgi:hypothetical protein